MSENLYSKHWESRLNIQEKTTLTATFLLDDADMTFLIDSPKEARIFLNERLYKLSKNSTIENRHTRQLIKLELEQVPYETPKLLPSPPAPPKPREVKEPYIHPILILLLFVAILGAFLTIIFCRISAA